MNKRLLIVDGPYLENGQSRFNEGRACDAVIRWIEMRENASRQQLRFPEQEQHPHPVELTCVIGDRLFAFEHTGIEPFENQIRLEVEAHFAPLRQQFSHIVPVGEQYELRVPAHATRALTGSHQMYVRRTPTASFGAGMLSAA